MTSMEGGSCSSESLNKESSLYLKTYKTERHATLEKSSCNALEVMGLITWGKDL